MTDETPIIPYPLIDMGIHGDYGAGQIIVAFETIQGQRAITMTPSQADQLVAGLLRWSAQSPLNLQGRSSEPGVMRVEPVDAQEVGISDAGDGKSVVLAFPVGLLTLGIRIGWNKLARVLQAYSNGMRQSPPSSPPN